MNWNLILGSINEQVEGVTDGGKLEDNVANILNTVTFSIGIVIVIVIIIAGVNYSTSQGDPAKVKKAKDTILFGVIGLLIVLLSWAIVGFVLGIFN
jgi:hypothetical protein